MSVILFCFGVLRFGGEFFFSFYFHSSAHSFRSVSLSNVLVNRAAKRFPPFKQIELNIFVNAYLNVEMI